MEFVKKNIDYPLGADSINERSVPMLASAGPDALGKFWDSAFGRIHQIHQALTSPLAGTRSPEIVAIIESLWVAWCFASNDVTRLREQAKAHADELSKAESAVREIVKTQQQLAEQVAELQARLEALEPSGND